MDRPVLVYDGDCSFCRRWVLRLRHLTRDVIDYQPYQTAAANFPQVPKEEFGKSVFLFEPDGSVSRAAGAIFRALRLARRKPHLTWAYRFVPLFRPVSEGIYSFVARHRSGAERLDKLLLGREAAPISYMATRSIFLRAMGIVYLVAFWSLYVQMDGLIGSNGIVPAARLLDIVRSNYGVERYWLLPTLAWLKATDGFLHLLCLGGMVGAILLTIGVAPMLMCICLWSAYLSLVSVADPFLSFQWDTLLLETGFLAIFFSPPIWIRCKREPSRLVLWLIRWLLFRLMFLSGVVKLTWQDEAWRDFTALKYHYESQPLPTWASWYVHHFPLSMHKFSTFMMFAIELVVPFFIFAPRRLRWIAFWGIIALQLMIGLTGNYGFFNLLTAVLCLPLLDDAMWPRWMRVKLPAFSPRPWRWPMVVRVPLVALVVLITTVEFFAAFRKPVKWPEPVAKVFGYASPFRSINGYGLFRVMTRERFVVIIEGSNDGRNWKEYGYKYQTDDPRESPRFCEPHMPRLDWQLWFAALSPRPDPWFHEYISHLLRGNEQVLALMDHNPFPETPPKFIRAIRYRYHFTDSVIKKATGQWWSREPVDLYFGPASLTRPAEDFHL